jgi:monofunctional biosynthetic peptidoglycan transglycosylase
LLVVYHWADPPLTGIQLQRRVEAMFAGSDYQPRQQRVTLQQVPMDLRHAVLAAEDGAFYDHSGVDWDELKKIIRERADGGRLRGASTISQQLAKNLFFTAHRSPLRKLIEFTLVPVEEAVLSKDRILEIYLNEIEWGPGIWGAAAAADYHYGKPLAALTREQCARLAACIPAPRSRRPDRMNDYSQIILERMSARGW